MKQNRMARVLEGMAQMGLDQLLVPSTDSVYYLTGLWIDPGERLMALCLNQQGDATLYVNRMFAANAVEGMRLIEFDDGDDSLKILAGGLNAGTLGVDKFWPSQFSIGLNKLRRDITLEVGSKPVDDARMCKDAQELDALRRSSRINDAAVGALRTSLVAGDTELGVGRRFVEIGTGLGAQGSSFRPLVCFGANAAGPHHNPGNAVIAPGDAVILDLGLNVDHAMSDMTRTVFFGSATDEQKKVYDVVLRANAAGKAAVRPGIALRDIDRAARSVIEEAGYGAYFLHRTGHGIGLAVHEPPDVSTSSEAVAQPGMVFSIEPGIYLSGRFGVRIEDLVAVTEDGCEVLNHLDREPLIIGKA